MNHGAFVCVVTAILAAAVSVFANDLSDVCHAYGTIEVIFVGRVKSAPVMRRVSVEEEIEKARAVMEAAERNLREFEALKMPPEIGAARNRDLSIRMVNARDEFERTRAMHPPAVDLSVTPILVEIPFRGVTTPELFLLNEAQAELDPARSYLFYATRPLGPLAPDVISAGNPVWVESAEAELRFLHEAVVSGQGTIVQGSVKLEDPDDHRLGTPLAGVPVRISANGDHYETSTAEDGTFTLGAVPSGELRIDPVVADHLMLPSQSYQTVSGGCLAINLRATFNGRIRGRVGLESGEPFRGFVDLVRHGHERHVPNSHVFTNERGEFLFSAVPPGDYLLGINVTRQPQAGAPFEPVYFPGTTDRSLAAPVTVGLGTEHTGIEWTVGSRLGEGSMEVTFDTPGESQKETGVCVTMYDAQNHASGGLGYRSDAGGLVVPVVEGVRYRFVAHARTPSGFARSDEFDFIGEPGRHSLRMMVASTTQIATGSPCGANSKPFSPSR